MLLAIDVGNTNIIFALVEDLEIRARWRISTNWNRTADEYGVWLHQLLALAGVEPAMIDSVIIASVVPQTLFNLRGLARYYFDVEPMICNAPGISYGMPINLPNPQEVGADRVVNAVAAHAQWPGDLIIVDFGTATTFDVVSGDGVYEGGAICPGVNISMDALYLAASRLPRIAVEPPRDGQGAIGKGTVHAMHSGAFWGQIGMIEGLIVRMTAEIGRPATVIGTGGIAPLFARHTAAIHHVDGDLTIKGLIHIHQLNQKAAA
ncbi:MAG: type III pantothenate kinase [Sphingomonadaceae bacterium]